MKPVQYPLAGILLVLLAACGGEQADSDAAALSAEKADSPKEIMDVYEAQMIRIADAVETVSDEESAEAAALVIRDASSALETLAAKVETMSGVDKARLAMNYSPELIEAQTRLATEIQRLSQNGGEQLHMISEAMDNLPAITE